MENPVKTAYQLVTGDSDLKYKIDLAVFAAIARDKRLTKWEKDFLFDIGDKIGKAEDARKSFSMSKKQIEIIERIADKVHDAYTACIRGGVKF